MAVPVHAWKMRMLMLLVVMTVTNSCVGALTIKGYPISSRCRAGLQFTCLNLARNACCDFRANNQAVIGVLFEGIRAGQWMSIYDPLGANSCYNMKTKKEHRHGAPRAQRCMSGTAITGAKWHSSEPRRSLLDVDTLSHNSTEGCTEVVHAVPMIWNSTLQEYTLVH